MKEGIKQAMSLIYIWDQGNYRNDRNKKEDKDTRMGRGKL